METRVVRRDVLRAAAAAGLLAVTACACTPAAPQAPLLVSGGVDGGIYQRMSLRLADIWTERLGLRTRPVVTKSAGSVENLHRLATREAQLTIAQVDVTYDVLRAQPDAPTSPRALARLYDEVLHVVVRADSPYRTLADLRGARVSIGPAGSGYAAIARRLLAAAGIGVSGLGETLGLGLEEATAALAARRADAFFWSGGVPTSGVADLAARTPIRLVDLSDVMARGALPPEVYTTGTVPAAPYRLPGPVSTLAVRSVLLTTADLPDELARSLVEAVFGEVEQQRLAEVSPAAVTIDSRSAIGTQPIPLHPGAEEFYRGNKRYSG